MSQQSSSTGKVRVRFAPSPTGQVHVGNARTALFNWLFARQQGGAMVLRIEDTDIERSESRYERQLLDDLKWLGLDWDEGPDIGGRFPPYRQSNKLAVYLEHAERLVAEDKAYYCFCTPEELDQQREQAMKEHRPPIYPGTCRKLDPAEAQRRKQAGEPCAIRLHIPERPIRFHDMVRGAVEFSNEVVSDPIILRSSGVPVYNYVVVIDDAEMQITHVIRGDDHLSNTPKQVARPSCRSPSARRGAPLCATARISLGWRAGWSRPAGARRPSVSIAAPSSWGCPTPCCSARWDIACAEKRLGRHDAAVAAAADLAGSRNPYRVRALEELARHYERRERNYAMALEMTRAARALEDTPAIRRREQRLAARLEEAALADPAAGVVRRKNGRLSIASQSSRSTRRAGFQPAMPASSPAFFEECRYGYRHGRRDARSTARSIMPIICAADHQMCQTVGNDRVDRRGL